MNRSERIEFFSKDLYPLFLIRYRALFKTLGPEWMPYFGMRDLVTQQHLYAQGRTAPGKIVTNAQFGESAHNFGCAVDLTLFKSGIPVYEHDRWNELAEACKLSGLEWGGNFKSLPDKPHVQLPLRVSWKNIGEILRSNSMPHALLAINKNLLR